MIEKCPYDEKPDIGYKYDLIYIHSHDLTECIGSESTGPFYIMKDNRIVGSDKDGGAPPKTIKLSPIPFLQLIHIGKLRVTKTNKWGSHKFGFEYSVVGESELFDDPIYDGEQVEIWKKYVDDLIVRYHWMPHLKS
tara:strand:+ start:494 stop:901 length:408 start_codon:yes stop_codon:yes gene_type:complete